MIRSTRKEASTKSHGELSLMNQLPNEVLCHIISSLRVDETVKSSILSKRWKPLWKHASCLDFDWRNMIKPCSQTKNSMLGTENFDLNQGMEQDAHRYGIIVNRVLQSHLGDLTSCRFKHFPQSISIGDVENLVKCVISRNESLSSLSLECKTLVEVICKTVFDRSRNVKVNFEPRIFSNLNSVELTNYALSSSTSSAFESCEKLKILKLKKMLMEDETINCILKNCLCLENFSLIESVGFKKLNIQNPSLKYLELEWLMVNEIDVFVEDLQVVVLNSLFCQTKGIRIFAPNLRAFRSSYNVIAQRMETNCKHHCILKTQDIMENYSGLLGSQVTNIFQNLSTLSIDLDLNNIRETLTLSYILRLCLNLKNLEISIPVDESSNSNGSSDDCILPFPHAIFWERQEIYNCISHKLKNATIQGFTGKEQEMNFAKHLIIRANMIEKIDIICYSSIVDEAMDLLELPKASIYVSITLKLEFKNNLNEVAEVKAKVSQLKNNY